MQTEEHEGPEAGPSQPSRSSKPSTPSAPRTPKSPSTYPSRTERRYACQYPGCDKAYFKPSRLAEHELSHTGERPHLCPNCGQTYLRASHLHAHMRTHLTDDDRPHRCEYEGCGKKFWTATHLKRHAELHAQPRPFACEHCDATFAKAHQLRDHAVSHMPPGTKPFVCPHPGCGWSFALKAHLKTHEKTHDPDRYVCSHASHTADLPSFPTWSALQAHIHAAHAPQCPHDECRGRTFKHAARLKDHLKVHEQQAADLDKLQAMLFATDVPLEVADSLTEEVPRARKDTRKRRFTAVAADGEGEAEGEGEAGPAKKLRRVPGGTAGKDFVCRSTGCGKQFKTVSAALSTPFQLIGQKFALQNHRRAVHEGLKHHCPHEGCDAVYAQYQSLSRHLKSAAHAQTPKLEVLQTPTPTLATVPEGDVKVDLGAEFDTSLEWPVTSLFFPLAQERTYVCTSPASELGEKCTKSFIREHDLYRHLKAEHGLDLTADEMRLLAAGAA